MISNACLSWQLSGDLWHVSTGRPPEVHLPGQARPRGPPEEVVEEHDGARHAAAEDGQLLFGGGGRHRL